MKKDNFIFRDTNRSNVDNGETSHRGIEVTLHYAFTDTLDGSFFWSWARHQYENNPDLSSIDVDGNDIDTAPRHFGSAHLRWRPSPRLRTELEWIHMGGYYEDAANLNEYDGHDLFNLRLSYDATSNWQVFFRILNLADEAYAERADYSFGSDRYFVGEPISVYVGFRVASRL